VGESVELGGIDPAKDDPLTEQNLAMHTVTGVPGMRPTRYHHAAHNFTSPLGMCHPFFLLYMGLVELMYGFSFNRYWTEKCERADVA